MSYNTKTMIENTQKGVDNNSISSYNNYVYQENNSFYFLVDTYKHIYILERNNYVRKKFKITMSDYD